MKNNFQSKSVPRGTRTIWRYLSALFLLFTFAIGNVWAADPTHASPAIVKVANRNFLDLSSTPSNVTVSTDSYSNYGPGYFISNKNADLSKSWWGFSDTFKSSSSSYSNHKDAVGFHAVGSSSSSEFYQILQLREGGGRMVQMDFYVTGTTQIGFQWKNANTSGSKYLEFAIYEMNVSGTTATDGASPVSTIQGSTTSDADQYAASAALDGAKYYHVVVTPHNTSNINFYGLTFKHAPAASYTITYDANGGDGTMENSTNTVSECTFTAPTGKEFKEWNTLATGLGDSYDPGDAASSDLDLFAIWQTKVEKYTVKYMDGTTEVGSEVVEVGEHPTGSAITDPTKDCYTFAGWSPALNTVTGTDGQVVNVNATWTPNYAFGAYSFVNVAEVGTAPNKLTMSDGNTVNVPAGSRVDNFYFSAMAIKYESGASTALNDYKGWKINTKDATIKFLVENNSQVKVAIGSKDAINVTYTEPDGTAKNAISQGQQTEVSYLAKAGTLFTIKTATANTTTLKRITISPLYNATYTDETGDASGVASNVTEVTLPTPTETTVGTSTFTGWTANKVVYDGETAKAVGAALEAGKTYKLTATTTFTAQWAPISDFDVKFFQGYGDPNAQIGETQSISTGNFAVAPADPSREGYNFKGWSYDATEANIVNVAEYAITAATNFTAIWKQVFAVTFDGAGSVNVESGSKVASPNSPTLTGKVFQGWYNGESKYDFSAAVTADLALESKWAVADPNHFYYTYNDDFHFDGVVYKTPDGKTKDPEAAEASNVALATNPYTLFSGAAGITSIVATNGIYDYKKANNTKHITAYLKLKADDATSNVVFTIASGYTAVLKLKMNGYSSDATISLKKGDDAVTPSGTQGGTAEGKNYGELTYSLTAGEYKLTTANKTLYISHIDLEATVIPPHVVTYLPGEGSGPEFVIDDDATVVADCPAEFTAPAGKIFHGWKDALDNDVAVGAIVEADMTLTAQWIAHYAVTFDMQGHGTQIVAQDIVHGSKAVKPADPIAIGWDFGGWFTDAECTAGNEFDFDTPITAVTPLFAKWTAFDGCTVLVPATSGSTLNAGDAVDLQTGSTGGSIKALTANLSYDANGLLFGDNSSTKVEVTLTHLMKEGTVITATIYNADASKARGLNLLNSNGTSKATWTKTQAGDHVETYTVVADDGLDGSNVFQLQRNQNAYLKELKVSNCGTELIFHNLTSVVDPAGKGTVTLDANSVPEGHTTKATYSAIDPAYEFVSWSVSGEGASIADASANPATITMGTADAVVTLNLQLIPVKFTINYFDGATAMGTEQVVVNEHPTASEIKTAKRGYIFEGWAMSSTATASDVVALNTITSDVEATINLYAVYTEIPCPTEGTVFSMVVTDPAGTEYNGNDEFNLEIGATYVGGKAYSGSKNSTKRVGVIDDNGEYSFENAGDVTVKVAMDCALQEGDVITFTTSTTRELKIQKVAGTDLVTTSGKKYVIPAASPLIGAYDFYLERGNSQSTMKTFNVTRPAVLTGVTLADAVVAIDGKVTPVMTLAPAPDAYISSQVWSIEGAGEGTIATINTETGEVTGKAIGSVTVKVVLNGSIENTCTVTVIDSYTQVAVTETSEWNFAGAAAASSKINFPNSTEEFLLANISGVNNTPEFNSRALVVKGKYVSNSQLQAQTIRFNVTTSGKLTIRYACTSNKGEGNNRELYINGVATGSMTYNDEVTYSQVVPGGEVTIKALYDKESVLTEDIMNYKYIKFDVTPDVSDADYTRDVTEGRYGTICLPNGGVMVGAEIFTLAYYGATSQKFFFDEIASAEMEAGKPYLFFPHEGATQLGVYYTDAAGEAAKTVNGFVGFIGADADDYTQVPANDNCYIISNNLYRQVQTGAVAYILSNRAYIDMTSVTNIEPAKAPGARRIGLGVQGKDQAQGFENIETGDAPMKVMINGTMYILRGEKVYDATGRLVK